MEVKERGRSEKGSAWNLRRAGEARSWDIARRFWELGNCELSQTPVDTWV